MKNDCFYILSREPNTLRRGYSSPFDPPRQMWTVLAQPRYLRPPAGKSDECQIRDFLCYFQMKPQTHAAHCVCFYCEMLWRIRDVFFLEQLVRFYAPPASTRRAETAADTAAVAALVAAPHRRQTTETRPTLAGEGNFTPVGRGTDGNGDTPLALTLVLRRSNSKIRKTNCLNC